MTTLAKHMIVVGADNRPPMLEKTMYNSWQSRMLLYIKGKKHGRMMLNSILHGPLVYGTIEVDGVTRLKTYEELTDQEKLQDDCDVHATEVRLLRERFPDSLALVANFPHIPSYQNSHQPQSNPTHYQQQLSPVAQQYYSSQQHSQSYKAHPYHQQYQPLTTTSVHKNAYQSLAISQQPQAEFPQLDSRVAVPSFVPGDDPIASLNKAMAFLSIVIASCFPTTNNQLRTSSNLRNQATIQDGRVTVQPVQGRQGQSFTGMGSKSNPTSLVINRNRGNNVAVQARVVRCYNCQGEGHMARQRTQPKRPRNSAWFKEKILLVQSQEYGQVLDEEKLAFLADLGVAKNQDTPTTMTHNTAFQTDDLDAFDSDCDEPPGAKAILMANLSSYNSDVISETESADVQNTTSTKQQNTMIMSVFDEMYTKVANCNAESLKNKNVNKSLTSELERYKERVKMFEERQKVDLNDHEKYIDLQMNDMILNKNPKFVAFQKELKLSLSKNVKENASLTTTIDGLKKQMNEKENNTLKRLLDLEPLSSKLKNNREAHEYSLKKTKEHTDTLHGIIEQARKLNPRMKSSTSTSRSQPLGNTNNNRTSQPTNSNHKNKVKDHLRGVKSCLNKKDHVSECNASTKQNVTKANSKYVCKTCNKCLFNACHDACVVAYLYNVNKRAKSGSDGTKCPMTRITSTKVVLPKETSQTPVITSNLEIKDYNRKPKQTKTVSSSSDPSILGPRFGNDQIAKIMGYGDYQIGNVTIFRVYYVEGLGHNLFLVGSRVTNLYTLSLDDTLRSSPICLLPKASKPSLGYGIEGPGLYEMTLRTISSGLVQNPPSPTPYVPPTKNDWDILFQPMFDEYYNPPPCVVSVGPVTAALRPVDLIGSPSSTFIDQDAPSNSTSSATQETQSLVISKCVEEQFQQAPFDDDPFLDILTSESSSPEPSSIVQPTNLPFEHISKWTKIHPLENVIDNPSRSVSTRKQLQTDAIWSFFDAFLTSWIVKVEQDEFGRVLKNKARLVAKGYRQEEGIDFEESFRMMVLSCLPKTTLFTGSIPDRWEFRGIRAMVILLNPSSLRHYPLTA
ncbi:hypothetical protein Tco_0025703 [Tanacetum coccineum]